MYCSDHKQYELLIVQKAQRTTHAIDNLNQMSARHIQIRSLVDLPLDTAHKLARVYLYQHRWDVFDTARFSLVQHGMLCILFSRRDIVQ